MYEDDINKQRRCIFLLAQQTKQKTPPDLIVSQKRPI